MSDSGIDLRASGGNGDGGVYRRFSCAVRASRATERLRNYRIIANLTWCAWVALAIAAFSPVKLLPSAVMVSMLVVLSFGILVYLAQRVATTGDIKYLMALILISAQYAYFCLPFFDPAEILTARFMGIFYNPSHTLHILEYSIVFILLFIFGFLASPIHGKSLLRDSEWHRLNNYVFTNRTVPILMIMGGSMLLLNFRLDEHIPPAFAFAGHLLAFAFPLCVIALAAGSTSKLTWLFVFGVLYPVYYLIRIADGFVAEWVLVNLIMFIGYVLLGKRPPFALAVVAAVLTVPLLRAKEVYRNDANVGYMTRFEAGKVFLVSGLDVPAVGLDSNETESRNSGDRLTTSREMAGPIVFSRVLDYHESGNVTYQWGATFADLPLSVIPRAVAPWKPEKNFGQWFGHTYGIIKPGDQNTSVNLPPIVESYVNFGNFGVLLAVLLGGICAFLYDLFGGGKSTISVFLIIAIFAGLTNTELSISLGYGQVLQMSLVAWVLLILLRQYSGMRVRRVLAKET
ncbi:MAG TPA: hypothetical protein VGR47_21875 [Terracidiphilus sp.]|nr:hypothetical protein [Terracidiphilus sp.]